MEWNTSTTFVNKIETSISILRKYAEQQQY